MTKPEAGPSSRSWRVIGRNALVTALFVLALVASCELLARYQPPSDPDVAPQCRYFAERKNEFDTIFIGSSRIRFHVDPKQFDAETAQRGAPTRSLNLGFRGMWPPETYYYLRQLLAMRPAHLRWVILEVMDYRFGQVEYIGVTRRTMVWHDWKHTDMVFRRILESPNPASEKCVWLTRHAQCFLQRSVDPGRGSKWLRERYFPPKRKPGPVVMDRGGFDPQPKVEWDEKANAEFAQAHRDYEQAAPRRVRPGLASALREIIDEIRQAGAEPILVLPPSTRPEEKLMEGLPQGVNVWAFNDPAIYPRFYLPELLYDPGHLNEEGAREFTSLLAQRFADFTQKR